MDRFEQTAKIKRQIGRLEALKNMHSHDIVAVRSLEKQIFKLKQNG